MFVQRLFDVCARFLPRVMLCVHFISFTASAQKTGPKPAVHFSILGESGSSLLAEGTVDVLVDPKTDTASIRVICVEIDRKHKTPYLFINFWTSRDGYKKNGAAFASYKGDKYAGSVYVVYPNGTTGDARNWFVDPNAPSQRGK